MGKVPGEEDNADVRTLRQSIAAARQWPLPGIGATIAADPGPPAPTTDEMKEVLRENCNRQIERLRALAATRAKIRGADDARHNFDGTPAGKEIRREHAKAFREMMKMLDPVTEM